MTNQPIRYNYQYSEALLKIGYDCNLTLLKEMKFTHFVVFNFNLNQKGYINPQRAHKIIERFRDRVDSELYSNSKYSTRIVVFIQNPDHDFGCFAMITTADANGFNAIAPHIWQKLLPTGSLIIENKIFTDADKETIAAYMSEHINPYNLNVFPKGLGVIER